MPSTIILVPDIYFHKWDERPGGKSGEMWLCLRPMVATGRRTPEHPLGDQLDNFLDWARSPHTAWEESNRRYEIKSPDELQLGTRVCDADEVYLPINLPSDLDVQIRIGRRDALGNELPEDRIDIKRTLRCNVVAGAQTGEDAFGALGPGAKPFARMFNDKVAEQFGGLLGAPRPDQGKIDQATFAFLQQMEAGRRIRFKEAQVRGPFDDPKVARFALESDPARGLVTSVYWFMGLMVRLGTQADLEALRRIDRVDIALRDSSPKDYGFIPFPNLQGGNGSAAEYFGKVGDGFAHSLVTELKSHESRIYVGPGFRGLQQIKQASAGSSLWVMENEGPQAAKGASATKVAHSGLARLAAIEIRGHVEKDQPQAPGDAGNVPPQEIGQSLSAIPGLYVSGTLKRYRRFPDVSDGGALRVTVMIFEPDPAVAAELAKLRDAYGDEGLRRLLKTIVNGWQLELLHGGVLPWDGPNPIYRMLAIPTATANTVGSSLVCQETSASFFLPALTSPLKMLKVGARHLWDPRQWGPIGTPLELEERWAAESGAAWKNLKVNAFKVEGIEPAALDRATAHVMLLDEFDLLAAESPLRLEKILAVTALSPRMASLENLPVSDPRNFDPLRDYEDDFINFNTVRVWQPKPSAPGGEVLLEEGLLRSPQRSEANPVQCLVGGAQRRQTIPLLHSWPFEPLDLPERQKPAKVSWKNVRDEIARRYNLIDEPDGGPYRVDLEHSYGDRRAVTEPGGAGLRINRSTRRSWPVELPTFVEAKDKRRFVTCKFLPGVGGDVVELDFEPRFLMFTDLAADAAHRDERYTLALSAWRAIAELASPGATLALHVIPATFDVLAAFRQSDTTFGPARTAAERGFVGGWASGIKEGSTIPINGGTDLDAIQTWARTLIAGGTPRKKTFRIRLAPTLKLGEIAHLLRVDLEIVRSAGAAPVPPPAQELVPISQQPGLFQVSAGSMQGAWATLGFGPMLNKLDAASAGPVWAQLQDASNRWTEERSRSADSITPEALPPLPDEPVLRQGSNRSEREKREVQAALVAALDGSDWFAPKGTGPRTKRLAVEPVLLPVGFAPCRPHIALKQQTHDVLQRLMTALRDAVDLAYPGWTKLTANDWQAHFKAIADMAREAGPSQPAGILVALTDLLLDRLFFPQPDAMDPGNSKKVRDLAAAIRAPGNSDLKWFVAAVRRRLLADPALFTDAKALLLTAVDFVPNPMGPLMPPPNALARARFNRLGVDPDNESKESTSTLTLDNLIFVGKSPSAPIEEQLGFLEALDDARYGNAFELPAITAPAVDYIVDSYEELVDSSSDLRCWPQRPAVLPLAAANDGRARRLVHLASRALVSPPLLRFAGESSALDTALANRLGDWSIENLERGKPGMASANATRLRIAALLQKDALPQTIERGVAFTLYRVTGDEERPRVFEQAFSNDSFFFRLRETQSEPSPQPEAVVGSKVPLASEALLRDLLFASAGSDLAAEAVRKFALAGTNFAGDLAEIIATGKETLPGPEFAMIRLVPDGSNWKFDVAGLGARKTIDAIRHVALFKPENAGGVDTARTAYLLVGFETSVWEPLEADMSHGRNLPLDTWSGPSSAINPPPRFAPQFWQSVAQDAPASRHSLEQRSRLNNPGYWRLRPSHVIGLDSSWRQPKTPRALLEKLLFEAGHGVGSVDRSQEDAFSQRLRIPGVVNNSATNSILSAASKGRIFDQQLSIQIAHEQFGEDPTPFAEPLGSFPLETNTLIERFPATEPAAVRWFDPLYDQFSISLRWFAPSGTSLLALERIFIEFT